MRNLRLDSMVFPLILSSIGCQKQPTDNKFDYKKFAPQQTSVHQCSQDIKSGLSFTATASDYALRQGRKGSPTRISYSLEVPVVSDANRKGILDGSIKGPGMNPTTVRQYFEAGLKRWAEVAPLWFVEVNPAEETPDISIFSQDLGNKVMGWGSPSFIFMGNNWTWTEQTWTLVVAHEIGHALGLFHTDIKPSIMQPNCCGERSGDDVAGIQSIYGAGQGNVFPYRVDKGKILPLWIAHKTEAYAQIEWTPILEPMTYERLDKRIGTYYKVQAKKIDQPNYSLIDIVRKDLQLASFRVDQLEPKVPYSVRVCQELITGEICSNSVEIKLANPTSDALLPNVKMDAGKIAEIIGPVSGGETDPVIWAENGTSNSVLKYKPYNSTKKELGPSKTVLTTAENEFIVHIQSSFFMEKYYEKPLPVFVALTQGIAGSKFLVFASSSNPEAPPLKIKEINVGTKVSKPRLTIVGSNLIDVSWIDYSSEPALKALVLSNTGNIIIPEVTIAKGNLKTFDASTDNQCLKYSSLIVSRTCRTYAVIEGSGDKMNVRSYYEEGSLTSQFKVSSISDNQENLSYIRIILDVIYYVGTQNGKPAVFATFDPHTNPKATAPKFSMMLAAGANFFAEQFNPSPFRLSFWVHRNSKLQLLESQIITQLPGATDTYFSYFPIPPIIEWRPDGLTDFRRIQNVMNTLVYRSGDAANGKIQQCLIQLEKKMPSTLKCRDIQRPQDAVEIGHPTYNGTSTFGSLSWMQTGIAGPMFLYSWISADGTVHIERFTAEKF